MNLSFFDIQVQYKRIKPIVDARMAAVVQHGQFILGPEVGELEERLAAYTGSKYCIGCSSGTDALLMALMALGVGHGDEVVTTPFTFIATAETIALVGAKAIFVDIDPRTYGLDATKLEQAITPATRAIIVVSLYGQCADIDAINQVASAHSLPVIEDAAQSFGATYKGRRSCNLATIGCTSFFPSKPLGCYGDGGACFTSNEQLATTLRRIRVHGQDRRYHHAIIGINGRLDTLQAAVVLAKLEVFEQEVVSRQAVATEYDRQLQGAVITPYIQPGNVSAYGQYTVRCENRDDVAQTLQAAGIPTAVHYPLPLHLQPAFANLGYRQGDFPHAEYAAKHVLSLPMHPYLSSAEISAISSEVHAATSCGALV